MRKPNQISGSVGDKGRNLDKDVVVVQRLLMESRGRYGELAAIVQDGVCRDETIAAIRLFQRNAVGISNPDGRIDPSGRTLPILAKYAEHVPTTAGVPGQVAADLSDKGLALIAKFEGCVLHLYNDVAGYATIGYGHLVHKGKVGTNVQAEAPYASGLTQEGALSLLREDAGIHVNAVKSYVSVPLLQNQFDALVCLSFNIGTNGLRTSTLVRIVNGGKATPNQVRDAFCMWQKAGGKVNQGLLARRNAEATVYNGGAY